MKKSGSYFTYSEESINEQNKSLKTNEPTLKIADNGKRLVTDVLVTDDEITKKMVYLGVAIGELINQTMLTVNMEGNEKHTAEVLSFYMSLLVHPVFAKNKPIPENFYLLPILLWTRMEASIPEFTTLDQDWINRARLKLSTYFEKLSNKKDDAPIVH